MLVQSCALDGVYVTMTVVVTPAEVAVAVAVAVVVAVVVAVKVADAVETSVAVAVTVVCAFPTTKTAAASSRRAPMTVRERAIRIVPLF